MSEEKFLDNLASAWRMYSARFVFLFSSLGAYFFTLPAVCQTGQTGCLSQTEILSHLFVPAWMLPYLLGFIPFIVFRAMPQRNMTEALAGKKSAETPPA